MRGWTPGAFRATIQGYFLLTGPAILIGQGAAGLWTAAVWKTYLFALPLVGFGIWLGLSLGRKIPDRKFHRWIYGLLLAAGAVLLVKTIF
jgi:hypothetical protein